MRNIPMKMSKKVLIFKYFDLNFQKKIKNDKNKVNYIYNNKNLVLSI